MQTSRGEFFFDFAKPRTEKLHPAVGRLVGDANRRVAGLDSLGSNVPCASEEQHTALLHTEGMNVVVKLTCYICVIDGKGRLQKAVPNLRSPGSVSHPGIEARQAGIKCRPLFEFSLFVPSTAEQPEVLSEQRRPAGGGGYLTQQIHDKFLREAIQTGRAARD